MNPIEQLAAQQDQKRQLIEAKVQLCRMLHGKPRNELSYPEVDILYALLQDSEVQEFIQRRIK